jgi:hypothetical protein
LRLPRDGKGLRKPFRFLGGKEKHQISAPPVFGFSRNLEEKIGRLL